MLTVPSYLIVLLVLRNVFLEDLFHDFPSQSEAEWHVVPWIFEDVTTFAFLQTLGALSTSP